MSPIDVSQAVSWSAPGYLNFSILSKKKQQDSRLFLDIGLPQNVHRNLLVHY